MSSVVANIEQALLEKFKDPNFADLFPVEITENAAKVYVFIDGDKGLEINRCARISRYLEELIETNQWLPEKYYLEVSSPGASKPLIFPRQYPQHIGRTLEVKITGQDKPTEGQLGTVDTDSITLLVDSPVPGTEGKKKKDRTILPQTILFSDIKEAKVKIQF
jgi:ribosome maturation factor RimP